MQMPQTSVVQGGAALGAAGARLKVHTQPPSQVASLHSVADTWGLGTPVLGGFGLGEGPGHFDLGLSQGHL